VPLEIPEAVRRSVARGANCQCEYCLFPEQYATFRHQIDHIISVQHGGQPILENLAYACIHCNRFKGPNIAALDNRGQLSPLFNPRRQSWSGHFRLDGAVIEPLTSIGEATVRLLRINDILRIQRRFLLQQAGVYPRNWQELS
jgi:hypothetical protein